MRALLLPAGLAAVRVAPRAPPAAGTGSGLAARSRWRLLLAFEVIRSLTFGYRFDPHEIVITRGLIWKHERHIPYERVQNIELVQHGAAPAGRGGRGPARHGHRRRGGGRR